tara:strand:- start:153 stop:914 length:762 start_codon:yes stop_codon:yes gene_type:complete
MINIISQYFISNDPKRQIEIDLCFNNNLNNKYVDKIYFLYEKEEEKEYFKNKTNNNKLVLYPLNKRITYKDVLKFANKFLENKICVYLHADMHVTDDFGKLDYLDKDKMYPLVSHHHSNCNKKIKCDCTRQFNTEKGIYGVTFDGFIFLPKIQEEIYNNLNFEVNHMGAENKFIYEFKKQSYDVVCPNKDIRAIHRHDVQFHNRKDWISIDNTFKPLEYYSNIHKKQKKKKYEDKIVGGGIPFYLGSAKFIEF